MLVFKQTSAVRFEIGLTDEDVQRYRSGFSTLLSAYYTPVGELYKTGQNRWEWQLPLPVLNDANFAQLIGKLKEVSNLHSVPDMSRPTNFKASWQDMPNLEKGHETIKAAAVRMDEVKASLSAITGNPSGLVWDESAGDYLTQEEFNAKPKPQR